MGTLYIVGTPIGNLGDFSSRGIDTLNRVDFIAAEDTRVTRGLLTNFGISTQLISYHQHNAKERGEEIIARLHSGENCALVTDAGMPAISDPGQDLVALCHAEGLCVESVPGPAAVTTALAISGFASRRFAFEGFLEGKDSEKISQLSEVLHLPHTLVYYEAPHRLIKTLKLMREVLGNRKIALCRELTKLHEEVLHFTLDSAIDYYGDNPPRGEFVIIIEGFKKEEEAPPSLEDAVAMILKRQESGVSLSVAAKEVAQITGYKKGELYKAALKD